MELKVTGIVKELLPEQSGTSAKGFWRKREFILETDGNYPKQICMVQWGESIDSVKIGVGEKITASIDIASREHNGRWYTDVKAWKIEKEAAVPAAEVRKMPAPMGASELGRISDPDDDMPF